MDRFPIGHALRGLLETQCVQNMDLVPPNQRLTKKRPEGRLLVAIAIRERYKLLGGQL